MSVMIAVYWFDRLIIWLDVMTTSVFVQLYTTMKQLK